MIIQRIFVFGLMFTVAAPAFADKKETLAGGASTTQAERPWAKGVSPEKQKLAIQLFENGNALIKESLFVKAVETYRAALNEWDHPAIHYNLALALLNLDQPVEVYQHLEKALAYGAAPLDEEKFEHARSYKLLIEKQVTKLEVTCDTPPGAVVSFDGKPLFTAPGKFEGLVRAGQHNIVASKQGYVSSDRTEDLKGGKTETFHLKLYSASELTLYKHKWPVWMPYVVVGAGVLVAAVGGILYYEATQSYQAFDNGIKSCGGCVPNTMLVGDRDTGGQYNTGAVIAFAAGGTLAAVGVTLAIINRAQPYQVTPNERDKISLQVSPLIGPGTAGAMAVGHF